MDTPEVKATPIVLSPESRSSGRRVWGVRQARMLGCSRWRLVGMASQRRMGTPGEPRKH